MFPVSVVKVLCMAPQRASRSIQLMMYIPLEMPLQHNECLRGDKYNGRGGTVKQGEKGLKGLMDFLHSAVLKVSVV